MRQTIGRCDSAIMLACWRIVLPCWRIAISSFRTVISCIRASHRIIVVSLIERQREAMMTLTGHGSNQSNRASLLVLRDKKSDKNIRIITQVQTW